MCEAFTEKQNTCRNLTSDLHILANSIPFQETTVLVFCRGTVIIHTSLVKNLYYFKHIFQCNFLEASSLHRGFIFNFPSVMNIVHK